MRSTVRALASVKARSFQADTRGMTMLSYLGMSFGLLALMTLYIMRRRVRLGRRKATF